MPGYPWLLEKPVNFTAIQRRVDVMAMLGVPYGEAIHSAPDMAREQAAQIVAELVDQGQDEGLRELENKEVIALIAYMQRLGTDINKAPAPAEVPDNAIGAEPVAPAADEEAGQ